MSDVRGSLVRVYNTYHPNLHGSGVGTGKREEGVLYEPC